MQTTVATNTLPERKVIDTLLVIIRGFKDALQIGYQNRPHLFDLIIKLPDMLYHDVIDIEEGLETLDYLIAYNDTGFFKWCRPKFH